MTERADTDAPKPYRPSNGSEGLVFEHRFCGRCVHDAPTREDPPRWEAGCSIWAAALAFRVDEPEYPKELVREGLFGRCTKFEQDPARPLFDDDPRTFPLPSEIAAHMIGGSGA